MPRRRVRHDEQHALLRPVRPRAPPRVRPAITHGNAVGVMRCTGCRMAEIKTSQPAGPQSTAMCAKRMLSEREARLESTA